MKNKFIIIFVLLIFILFIPSFSHAVDYDDNGSVVSFPDFEFPEGTTDYVIFNYGNNREYFMFGFSDRTTASNCYLHYSGNIVSFVVPRKEVYWCAKYDNSFPSFGWRNYGSEDAFEWGTAQNAFLGDSLVIGTIGSNYHAVYTTFDIKYENGDIAFEDSTKLKLNLSVVPEEKTNNVPVLIASDWYLLEKWNTSLEVASENQMYDVYLHIPQVENPVRYR